MNSRVGAACLLGAVVLSLVVSLSARNRISAQTVVSPRPRNVAFGIAWGVIYTTLFATVVACWLQPQEGVVFAKDELACVVSLVLTAAWVPFYAHGSPETQWISVAVLGLSTVAAMTAALYEVPRREWRLSQWTKWVSFGMLAGWLIVALALNVGNATPRWRESLYAIPVTLGALLGVNGAQPALVAPLVLAFALTPMDVTIAICLAVASIGTVCAAGNLSRQLQTTGLKIWSGNLWIAA